MKRAESIRIADVRKRPALIRAYNLGLESAATIASNFAGWADAKRPRGDVADAENVICERIAALARAKKL